MDDRQCLAGPNQSTESKFGDRQTTAFRTPSESNELFLKSRKCIITNAQHHGVDIGDYFGICLPIFGTDWSKSHVLGSSAGPPESRDKRPRARRSESHPMGRYAWKLYRLVVLRCPDIELVRLLGQLSRIFDCLLAKSWRCQTHVCLTPQR